MTAGERIRKLRKAQGMTQDELAKKAGYKSRSSINKIECSRDLPLNKAKEIAAVLGCSPARLLGWEEVKELGHEMAMKDIELHKMPDYMKDAFLVLSQMPEHQKDFIVSLIYKTEKEIDEIIQEISKETKSH